MLIVKGHHGYLELGEIPADLVPQVHERLAWVKKRASHTQNTGAFRRSTASLLRSLTGKLGHYFPLAVDDLPRLGELYPTVSALRQLHTQLVLQSIELLHHRRRGHEQLFRSLVEAAAVSRA